MRNLYQVVLKHENGNNKNLLEEQPGEFKKQMIHVAKGK